MSCFRMSLTGFLKNCTLTVFLRLVTGLFPFVFGPLCRVSTRQLATFVLSVSLATHLCLSLTLCSLSMRADEQSRGAEVGQRAQTQAETRSQGCEGCGLCLRLCFSLSLPLYLSPFSVSGMSSVCLHVCFGLSVFSRFAPLCSHLAGI